MMNLILPIFFLFSLSSQLFAAQKELFKPIINPQFALPTNPVSLRAHNPILTFDYQNFVYQTDEKNQHELLTQELIAIKNLYYNDRFEEALNQLDQIKAQYLKNPFYFLALATFNEIHSNYGGHLNQEDLKKRETIFFDACLELGKLGIEWQKDPAKHYLGEFFTAFSEGLVSKFYAARGEYMNAALKGLNFYKTLNQLKEENEKKNKVDELILGPLGVFHYFLSQLGSFVSHLSWIIGGPTGDKNLGLKEIELAATKTGFFQIGNIYIYLPVLLIEEEFEILDVIAEKVLEKHPQNALIYSFYLQSGSMQNDRLEKVPKRLEQLRKNLQLKDKKQLIYYQETAVRGELLSLIRINKSQEAMDLLKIYEAKFVTKTKLLSWLKPYIEAAYLSHQTHFDQQKFKALMKESKSNGLVLGHFGRKVAQFPEWDHIKHLNLID